MTLAHMHLYLNHVPIIGIPIAMVFLGIGLYLKSELLQKSALIVLVAISAVVLPVYFTGEPAEERVEHIVGVSESTIESHEDAAEYSLILTLVAGIAAMSALWFQRGGRRRPVLNQAVMGVAVAAVASLVYTANLGGKIRHSEFGSGSVIGENATPGSQNESANHDDRDDD
jgi:hypothetical protein